MRYVIGLVALLALPRVAAAQEPGLARNVVWVEGGGLYAAGVEWPPRGHASWCHYP